ncbi:MAG: hypothetical protein ABI383_00565 [Acidobacteriaceae bacterium]
MPMRSFFIFILLCGAVGRCFAETEHATTILEAPVYLTPDTNSQKIGDVPRGGELAILEKSNNFVHVLAQLTAERSVTGWMEDKGVVRTTTPNADAILFGEASADEHEAEKRAGRKNAAQDALRLYGWIGEFLPAAPRAGEASYRAADIRWQLEKAENVGRPSNKEKDPYMRNLMNEDYLHKVEKKFPGTKWADLAAWDLVDNKLCGDWQGDPKCPEKETAIYLKYADAHPNSPRLSEAIYDAAWRQAAAMDLYRGKHDDKKAAAAGTRAIDLLERIKSSDDYAAQGARLLYMLQQNIPVYEYIPE